MSSKERPITLPPGDIVTTPGILDHMDLPKEVILDAKTLLPFLASQYSKFLEIADRQEIKTAAAEIPEPPYADDKIWQESDLTVDEQAALGSLRQEVAGMLMTQSDTTGGGPSEGDGLDKKIEDYIAQATRDHPEMFSKNETGVDVLGEYFTGKMMQETEEVKKKYQEILATAGRGGADAVILAMTYRHSQRYMSQMGKLLPAYRDKMEMLDQLKAKMELKGDKASSADLASFNSEFARGYGDINTINQFMRDTMSKLDSTMAMANSLVKTTSESEKAIIANMRG